MSTCDHEFDGETCEECGAWIGDVYAQVCEQRDELLESLKYLVDFVAAGGQPDDEDLQKARTVISKAVK